VLLQGPCHSQIATDDAFRVSHGLARHAGAPHTARAAGYAAVFAVPRRRAPAFPIVIGRSRPSAV
jgi:hypothetical protein